MTILGNLLELDRCPHCGVYKPHLQNLTGTLETLDYLQHNKRWWILYGCQKCGGAVLANSYAGDQKTVGEIYPKPTELDLAIPPRPENFLRQAIDCLHSPSGAVMLAASAVNAMLKVKG